MSDVQLWAHLYSVLTVSTTDSHVLSRSRPMSYSGIDEKAIRLPFPHLDDFTAVITTTILHALPPLGRLSKLLGVWSARCMVLRKAPRFCSALEDARVALQSGWHTIGVDHAWQPTSSKNATRYPDAEPNVTSEESLSSSAPSESLHTEVADAAPRTDSNLTKGGFHTMRNILEGKVASVGILLDSMLDALEGHEDTIPDQWIDEMESMEKDYADWVVAAEMAVLEGEWKSISKLQPTPAAPWAKDLEPQNASPVLDTNRRTMPSESYDGSHDANVDRSRQSSVDRPVDRSISAFQPIPSTPPPLKDRATSPRSPSRPTLISRFSSKSPKMKVSPSSPPEEHGRETRPHANSISRETTAPEDVANSTYLDETLIPHPSDFDTYLDQAPSKDVDLSLAEQDYNHLGDSTTNPWPKAATLEREFRLAPRNASASPPAIDVRYNAFKSMISPDPAEYSNKWEDKARNETSPSLARSLPESKDVSSKFGITPSPGSPSEALGRLEGHGTPLSEPPWGSPSPKQPTLHERRLGKLPLKHPNSKVSKRQPPSPSPPHSSTSSYFSDSSSPELEDASTAFFVSQKPVMVKSRPTSSIGTATPITMTPVATLSRTPSVNTEPGSRDQRRSKGAAELSPLQGKMRIRSYTSDKTLDERNGSLQQFDLGNDKSTSSSTGKRASLTSIELVQKGGVGAHSRAWNNRVADLAYQVKSIDVRRRNTNSATSPQVPYAFSVQAPPSSRWSAETTASQASNPLATQDVAEPSHSPKPEEKPSDYFNNRRTLELPPPVPQRSSRRLSELTSDPTLSYPAEDKTFGEHDRTPDPRDFPEPPGYIGTLDEEKATIGPEDDLEQRINSILTTIPAHIRLTSEPDPEPAKKPTRNSNEFSTPAPRPSRASTPSFTLAPAHGKSPRPSRQRVSNGPEVRLYHLRRTTGSEAPIKLFVRQVGENGERVMVRVGGGWADLGEYLREYAAHHGHRSVSDGRGVEFRDLPTPTSTGYPSIVRSSNKTTPLSSRPGSAQSVRPGSGLSVRKMRAPSTSTPTSFSSPITPFQSSAGGADVTPASNASSARSSSRMSTAGNDDGEPGSSGTGVGLAGLRKVRRGDNLSAEKQAWVEGLMGQVRSVSGGITRDRSESDVAFGDLGRVGGTKRVFRRGG